MKYLVTEEIESPNKVSKHIEAVDFFFVIIYMGLAFAFMSLVHEKLHIPYMIFSFLMCTFLTSKSVFNKKRRNYESMFMMLRHDITVYRAIYNKEEVQNEIQKEE